MTDRETMEFKVFALGQSRSLGAAVCRDLQIAPAAHEEREFDGGEHKARPLESVRERDVYVLHSLHGESGQSANDKLCRLLFFVGAVRDAGAARVTAVVPYLAYSRKDRRTKARDPVATRYVAALFEAVGADRIVTMDVHNPAAYENAFRIRTEHLEARVLFADHFAATLGAEAVAVLSPDAGGVKRAQAFRETLERRLRQDIPLAFLEKHRSEGVVSGEALVGEVRGRAVVVFDDLISSGTTMLRALDACQRAGARAVHVAATHGAFTEGAGRLLEEERFASIVITDSIPPRQELAGRLVVLPSAGLLAEAIRRMHGGGSMSELLERP